MPFHGQLDFDDELESDECGCFLKLSVLFLIENVGPSGHHDFSDVELSYQFLKAFLSPLDVEIIVDCDGPPLPKIVPAVLFLLLKFTFLFGLQLDPQLV